MDQQSQEIYSYMYSQLIWNKGTKVIGWGKNSLQQMISEQIDMWWKETKPSTYIWHHSRGWLEVEGIVESLDSYPLV